MNIPTKLLLVDDDPLITDGLAFALADGYELRHASDRNGALALIKSGWQPDLALLDLGLPPQPDLPVEGLKLIYDLLAAVPKARVVVLSGQPESTNALRARALGAMEFVPKPATVDRLRATLARVAALPDPRPDGFGLVGRSPLIGRLRQQIALYAPLAFPVLIEGESGTGKELIARALHAAGERSSAPFLALNCAALSAQLIEATLFGHAKGAFTGAQAARAGYFEDVDRGTLFLDEIGELPPDAQATLLRVLESGEFTRVGETRPRQTEARVVAATNRDLRAEVRQGRFRSDLYHRLSALTLNAPPLRELGADCLTLFDRFTTASGGVLTLAPSASELLCRYQFPGNARELRNIAIRLVAQHGGTLLAATELYAELDPSAIREGAPDRPRASPLESVSIDAELTVTGFSLDARIREVEWQYLDAAIRLTGGNMSAAAKLLGVGRTTLYSKLEARAALQRVDR